MPTAETVRVRVRWKGRGLDYHPPRFHELDVHPESGAPFGRKGRQLLGAWLQLSGPSTAGMLLLDGDVAIDLLDLAAMNHAIAEAPKSVHVAPVRNWSASTGRPDWEWGHWPFGAGPSSGDTPPAPGRFSFGFTYLPRLMFDKGRGQSGWDSWHYPWCDRNASELALRLGLDVRLVNGCHPKHLHY